MENRTKLGLIFTLPSEIEVSTDYQVTIPPDIQKVIESKPPQPERDPKEFPFMVMTMEHWNAFRETMDRLGVREEFRKVHGFCTAIHINDVRRFVKE